MLSSDAFSSRALRLFCLPMLAMCAAMACSDSSPPSDVAAPTMPPAAATGTVSLFMTDAPSDDFDEINVTVKEIKLEGGGSPKFTIFKGEATFDLKSLERFSDLFLVAADVPALTYEKIKMKVSAIELVDYDGDPEVIPLELPRGGKIELKTQAPFEVRPGGHLVIEIDMDAKKSIDLKLNRDGEYEFKPVVYVKIGEGRVPQKLSRVHGFVLGLAGDSDRFALCARERFLAPGPVDPSVSEEGSPYTAPEQVSGTSGSRRCITVAMHADTGVFDINGDPVDFDGMQGEVSVVGHFELSEDALPASQPSGSPGLVLNAAVIEEGRLGAFLQLSGLLEYEQGAPDDVLRFLLRPDQGFGASTSLPALLQGGTRIFDRAGEEYFAGELDDIVSADVDGVFGAFDDSGKLFYKASFVMLADEDGGPSGRAELEGVVRSVDLGARSLEVQSSDGPDRSVFVVPFGLGVHFVYEDDDDSVNEVGTLDELAPGTEVDVTFATWAASPLAPATSIVAFGPPLTSLP